MQSRVYALRPYTTIVGHYANNQNPNSLIRYELSILYNPYFRGHCYFITNVELLDDGGDRCYAICTLVARDCCDCPEVLSETVFVPARKGVKLIDTYFFFKVPEKPSVLDSIDFDGTVCKKVNHNIISKQVMMKIAECNNKDCIDDIVEALKDEGFECNTTSNNDTSDPPTGRIP